MKASVIRGFHLVLLASLPTACLSAGDGLPLYDGTGGVYGSGSGGGYTGGVDGSGGANGGYGGTGSGGQTFSGGGSLSTGGLGGFGGTGGFVATGGVDTGGVDTGGAGTGGIGTGGAGCGGQYPVYCPSTNGVAADCWGPSTVCSSITSCNANTYESGHPGTAWACTTANQRVDCRLEQCFASSTCSFIAGSDACSACLRTRCCGSEGAFNSAPSCTTAMQAQQCQSWQCPSCTPISLLPYCGDN